MLRSPRFRQRGMILLKKGDIGLRNGGISLRNSGLFRAPDGGLIPTGFHNDLVDVPIDRDGDVKVSGRKEAEYRTEAESHIERIALLLTVTAAEAFREGTGIKAGDSDGTFADLHGFNTGALTGAKAQQLPSEAASQKDCGQKK